MHSIDVPGHSDETAKTQNDANVDFVYHHATCCFVPIFLRSRAKGNRSINSYHKEYDMMQHPMIFNLLFDKNLIRSLSDSDLASITNVFLWILSRDLTIHEVHFGNIRPHHSDSVLYRVQHRRL